MRTLIDIPKEDLELIREITQEEGISRAEFVRQSIRASLDQKLSQSQRSDLSEFFGLWAKDRPADEQPEDGLAFQLRMRSEWDDR
jgi:Arc/MetJ-type ribon-helix-helix transcriptional regulator